MDEAGVKALEEERTGKLNGKQLGFTGKSFEVNLANRCYICNRSGHKSINCYYRQSTSNSQNFSEGRNRDCASSNNQKYNNNRINSVVTCNYCHAPGHTKFECRKKIFSDQEKLNISGGNGTHKIRQIINTSKNFHPLESTKRNTVTRADDL